MRDTLHMKLGRKKPKTVYTNSKIGSEILLFTFIYFSPTVRRRDKRSNRPLRYDPIWFIIW